MTLQEYISFWQETYDKSQSRPTTYAAHNYVFKNHIIPGLGDIPLSELTSEMVEDFLEERRRFGNHRPGSSGLGEETMRHIHRLLQQCLDQAMRDGLIGDNPARAFHYSKPKKVNADVLTPLEMEDYLDAAERLGHLPMFMLALTAGLRQGELIALKWNDLNAKNRTLTISEQRSVERRELIEYGSETRTITSVIVNRIAYFLRQERFWIVRSGLLYIHIFQGIRCYTLVKVGFAVVEHVLQFLPLLWVLLHPLVCGGGSFRVHGVYPAPIRLKLFIRLGILEGHELTALSAFTKSL